MSLPAGREMTVVDAAIVEKMQEQVKNAAIVEKKQQRVKHSTLMQAQSQRRAKEANMLTNQKRRISQLLKCKGTPQIYQRKSMEQQAMFLEILEMFLVAMFLDASRLAALRPCHLMLHPLLRWIACCKELEEAIA